MKKLSKTLVLTGIILATNLSMALAEPLQLSLTPEIALYDRNTLIEGLSLSLWGENPQRALALGVVNGSTGDSVGFSLGLLLNYSEDYRGVQWGFVNYNSSDFLGWQSGTINYSAGNMTGVQTGAVNYARSMKGVQFGVVNYAENVTGGLQIGLINVIRETHSWFGDFPDAVAPAMVLLNWRF